MISSLPTGNLFGITVTASMPTGIQIKDHDGVAAELAIIDTAGRIIAQGRAVEVEVFGVVLKAYDDFWVAKGAVKKLFGDSK